MDPILLSDCDRLCIVSVFNSVFKSLHTASVFICSLVLKLDSVFDSLKCFFWGSFTVVKVGAPNTMNLLNISFAAERGGLS